MRYIVHLRKSVEGSVAVEANSEIEAKQIGRALSDTGKWEDQESITIRWAEPIVHEPSMA